MKIRPFTRTTEASFPENEALPKKGEDDKQFDKRFREWWDDVKDNLARLDDQMSKFITTDLMEVIDTNKQSADVGLSLASKDTEEKFSSVGVLDGVLGGHISAINNPHAVTAEQLDLHALAKSGSWDDLKDIPTEFPPTAHNQAWNTITSKPTTFPPSTHGHAISDITELSSTLGDKSNTGHSHAYSTLTDIPDLFAPSAHSHAISDITDLSSTLEGKAGTGDVFSGDYGDLSNKPTIPTVPGVATTTANGLMSSGDKSKLDGMSSGGRIVYADNITWGSITLSTINSNGTGYEVPAGVTKVVFMDGTALTKRTTVYPSYPGPGRYWGLPLPADQGGDGRNPPFDNKIHIISERVNNQNVNSGPAPQVLLLL